VFRVGPDRLLQADSSVKLSVTALGIGIEIQCDDAELLGVLHANFGSLRDSQRTTGPSYQIRRQSESSSAFLVVPQGRQPLMASDLGALLGWLDADLAVELQKFRRDLYFVHAAVLERSGRALMLVAPSGGGKSTTAWALLHHGMRYLSDELAPVNLETLQVQPYPRALCLKTEPPDPYALPATIPRTSRGLHVEARALPASLATGPAPLDAIFFLSRRRDPSRPTLRPISGGEAAAHLYANALNPLAHSGAGLDGAIRIAKQTSSFELPAAELPAICAFVIETVDGLRRAPGRPETAPPVR
jgi:hypothetical protein